jgi:hypothetical protein
MDSATVIATLPRSEPPRLHHIAADRLPIGVSTASSRRIAHNPRKVKVRLSRASAMLSGFEPDFPEEER